MGLLLIQPHWNGWSEVWSMRMTEAVAPRLVAVAAGHTTETRWNGRVPIIRLQDESPACWRRMARRFRVPVGLPSRRSALETLRKAVNDDAVSVIMVHYLDYALRFDEIWRRTDKPLFVHCHGYDTEWDLRVDDDPNVRCFDDDYMVAARELSARATIIANSHCTAGRLYAAGIHPSRVIVKYLGVPIPTEPPTRHSATRGIELLFLGRLVDCKGPDMTIRAFEHACYRGLDARLTIAGDGPLRTTCELLRRHSPFRDRIRLVGVVTPEEGERLRAKADIFTAHNCRGPLTHQEEAFGVGYIEAMASGLPVVTGDSGGLRETVINNETGVLFEPGDIETHAATLIRLAHDPDLRHRMGRAAWKHVAANFSQNRERRELLAILGFDPAEAHSAASVEQVEARPVRAAMEPGGTVRESACSR